MNYKQIIPYSLPNHSAKYYSDKALEILKEIESVCPAALPIFCRSDIALTLSGVRSYDAYVGNLTEFLSEQDIQDITNMLRRYKIFLENSESEYPIDTYGSPWFYMLNENALKEIPKLYKFDSWVDPIPPYNLDRFLAWQSVVGESIHYDMVRERLPRKWSQFYWALTGIWEGMLYGYPAIAITSYNDWDIAMIMARDESEEPEPMLGSKVAYHDMYFAPHVSYSFPKELENDESIKKHEQLWSEIMTNIYESDWHQHIAESAEFKKTLRQVELAED